MSSYPIFSVLGIEIEYMLVDCDTLSVQPKSDLIINDIAGQIVNEIAMGDIALSNELVMHVVELKNNGPKPPDAPISHQFQQAIKQLEPHLRQHNLQLLPTGAHPLMNPQQETKRWMHDNKAIYQQYDRIFNCQGHGWSNLQSMHVNLPFANDQEFSMLHNSVRLLLPLIPALAASSPFLEGKATGLLDSRLQYYAKNQARIPTISGDIIPEFVCSKAEYQARILEPMYQDIRPFDAQGLLQHEWLNSRGAIAKFDSMAVEIRIIDSQECVDADIAIAQVLNAIIKSWNTHSQLHLQTICPTSTLKAIYECCLKEGLDTRVDDKALLEQWQLPRRAMSLRDAWSFLIERTSCDLNHKAQSALEHILSKGNLSERILKACTTTATSETIKRTYRTLSECLMSNHLFDVF